jgi:hypothetical protein
MQLIASIILLTVSLHLAAQQTILLYPSSIPNSTAYQMKEIKMEKDWIFS